MNNGRSKEKSKQDFKSKSEYKVHKRKIKKSLIFLVGLHVFLIFCFAAMTCTQYLTEAKNQEVMEILSDCFYLVYFILVLFSVKYKLKSLMVLSIITLVLSAGLKVQLCIKSSLDSHKLNWVYTLDLVFVLLNCIVPWRFLILWNELKQRKWRETFDLRFKQTSYLLQDQIKPSN